MVTGRLRLPTVDFFFQVAFAATPHGSFLALLGRAHQVQRPLWCSPLFCRSALFHRRIVAVECGWRVRWGFIGLCRLLDCHSFGAWAGLVGAIILGPASAKFVMAKPRPALDTSMALHAGCLILWIGWYGLTRVSVLAWDSDPSPTWPSHHPTVQRLVASPGTPWVSQIRAANWTWTDDHQRQSLPVVW